MSDQCALPMRVLRCQLALASTAIRRRRWRRPDENRGAGRPVRRIRPRHPAEGPRHPAATEEINTAGGIAGRKIELVIYDTQSDNTRYQEFMRRVLQRDKVDVVFAGFSSASREAYRPIVDQLNGFAFYNNQYEGGVCDAHMIVTGAVPEQQFSTLIPWMMEKYGKKVYTIAADYNFGQISAEWVRKIVKQNGGEMVGEEFIPLGVSQFSPDHPEHPEGQAGHADDVAGRHRAGLVLRAGGCRQPEGADGQSVNVGQGYEHKRFTPPSLANMYVDDELYRRGRHAGEQGVRGQVAGQVPERALHQPGGGELLLTPSTSTSRWSSGPAASTKRDEDPQGDRQGRCLRRRAGRQGLHRSEEPAHVAHDLSGRGRRTTIPITFPKVWNDIKPYWLGEAGCDLTKTDPMAQYTPSNPPPKELSSIPSRRDRRGRAGFALRVSADR